MAHIENLKKLRRSKNLTQKELAEVIGVDRTTYVKYESGDSEPSFETLIKLADFFEVSLDYLFCYEPRKKEIQTMGNNMKKARELEGLSQEQAALQLNVSTLTLSDWENGITNPSVADLIKLSSLYYVSTDFLLGNDCLLWRYLSKRMNETETEESFASRCGVSLDDIERIKGGKPTSTDVIRSIARNLAVDMEYLMCLQHHVNPHCVTNVKIPSDDIYKYLCSEYGDIGEALSVSFYQNERNLLSKDEEAILLKYRQMDEPDRAKLQERSDAILENEKYSPQETHTAAG